MLKAGSVDPVTGRAWPLSLADTRNKAKWTGGGFRNVQCRACFSTFRVAPGARGSDGKTEVLAPQKRYCCAVCKRHGPSDAWRGAHRFHSLNSSRHAKKHGDMLPETGPALCRRAGGLGGRCGGALDLDTCDGYMFSRCARCGAVTLDPRVRRIVA